MKPSQSNENDKIIALYSYANAFEAEVDRGLLYDAGLPCFLKNEIIGQVYPMGSSFEYELMIHESDFQLACSLLQIDPATGEKQQSRD